MNNNDVLRHLSDIFYLNDSKLIEIFALANQKVTGSEISNWLSRADDQEFIMLFDDELANFLNGFIVNMRGPKAGSTPAVENKLSNNLILKKIKIALDLKAEDVLSILELTGITLNKYELSAFLRKPKHKNYRPVKDRILRSFLKGLKIKHKNDTDEKQVE